MLLSVRSCRPPYADAAAIDQQCYTLFPCYCQYDRLRLHFYRTNSKLNEESYPMKTIAYATGNNGKFSSMLEAGRARNITVIQQPITIHEIQSDFLREIAEYKVKQAFALLQQPVICVDGGCFIACLNDLPGPYTK